MKKVSPILQTKQLVTNIKMPMSKTSNIAITWTALYTNTDIGKKRAPQRQECCKRLQHCLWKKGEQDWIYLMALTLCCRGNPYVETLRKQNKHNGRPWKMHITQSSSSSFTPHHCLHWSSSQRNRKRTNGVENCSS